MSRYKLLKLLSLAMLVSISMGCTGFGIVTTPINNYDFSYNQEIVFCTYKTKEVSKERVDSLMAEIADEYSEYNIVVRHEWNKTIERTGSNSELFRYVTAKKLTAPCDRRLVFLNYTLYDNLLALLGIDVLGAVETETMTNGYIFANYGLSINQLLLPPQHVVRHESLHLLGCEHDIDKSNCYEQIAGLRNQNSEDFFPGYSAATREYLLTRENVNNQLRKYRRTSPISLEVSSKKY